MIVTSGLATRSLKQTTSARLVRSTIISNIGPEPDMVKPVRRVRRSKATELVLGPCVHTKVSERYLERVGGAAVSLEVEEVVEDRCTLLVDGFADQSIDDSVTDGLATVRAAKEVGRDQRLFFVVWRLKLCKGAIT